MKLVVTCAVSYSWGAYCRLHSLPWDDFLIGLVIWTAIYLILTYRGQDDRQ